jgi:hypothetical protein
MPGPAAQLPKCLMLCNPPGPPIAPSPPRPLVSRLCADGEACRRKVCFFAHGLADLRTPPAAPSPPASGPLPGLPASGPLAALPATPSVATSVSSDSLALAPLMQQASKPGEGHQKGRGPDRAMEPAPGGTARGARRAACPRPRVALRFAPCYEPRSRGPHL